MLRNIFFQYFSEPYIKLYFLFLLGTMVFTVAEQFVTRTQADEPQFRIISIRQVRARSNARAAKVAVAREHLYIKQFNF